MENKNDAFVKELEKYKKQFFNEQKATNKSKHTISSYSNTINSFIEFICTIDDEISLKTIKRSNIIEFLEFKNEMLQKHSEISPNTKKLLITHLKTFFSYIEGESSELYDFRKLFDINIKIPIRFAKGLDKDETKSLISLLEKKKDENIVSSFRNSLIVKLMFYGGMRREEVSKSKLDDFVLDEENNIYTINIIGKGDKERETYIKRHYIDDEIEFLKENNIKYICSTKNGKLMDGSQIYRMIQSLYKELNIKATVHDLRHTFAKNLAEAGVGITIIQQLLGHSSIQTTSIYLTSTKTSIKNALCNI